MFFGFSRYEGVYDACPTRCTENDYVVLARMFRERHYLEWESEAGSPVDIRHTRHDCTPLLYTHGRSKRTEGSR